MGPRLPGTSETSAQRARPGHEGPLPAKIPSPLAHAASRTDISDRDIRSKRPPLLSFLLRMSTMRRVARVASLLVLDFAGIALAIFTALAIKEAFHGELEPSRALNGTKQFLPFAYLLTALLFARSGLYAERAIRPGLSRSWAPCSRSRSSRCCSRWSTANTSPATTSSTARSRSRSSMSHRSARSMSGPTASILRAAGYQRRAVLVGRGRHIGDVARALKDAPHSPIDVVGYLAPHEIRVSGVQSLGSLEDLE